MGNSSSRNKDLTIYIETAQTFYNSGSAIEGTVFVEAKCNFSFDALYIRVEGDEWCQWFEGSSKNRQKYTGSQNFYVIEHLLEKYHNQLDKGSYAYPFSIELAENIPGSFESKDSQGRIEYKLAAYFIKYEEQNNKEIQYIPLLIRQPFRQEFMGLQGYAKTQPKSCGFACLSKGTVQLQAKFDRNICKEGEKVIIDIVVNNTEGSSDLNGYLIELKELNFFSANSGVYRHSDRIIKTEKQNELILKGERKEFKYPLLIDKIDHQTAIGTLVANYYRIQVSTISGRFAVDNPCVYAPIFILKEEFELKSVPPPKLNQIGNYKFKKMQVFKAPQYWYKKNKNLSVMNFKLADQMELNNHD